MAACGSTWSLTRTESGHIEILLFVLYLACGVAAGWEARPKGYGYGLFLVLGVNFGPVTLIGTWLLPVRQLEVDTPVRPAAPVQLEDGAVIPPRHVSMVRRLRNVNGSSSARSPRRTPVCTGWPPTG